jgi:hypothetical protein
MNSLLASFFEVSNVFGEFRTPRWILPILRRDKATTALTIFLRLIFQSSRSDSDAPPGHALKSM